MNITDRVYRLNKGFCDHGQNNCIDSLIIHWKKLNTRITERILPAYIQCLYATNILSKFYMFCWAF